MTMTLFTDVQAATMSSAQAQGSYGLRGPGEGDLNTDGESIITLDTIPSSVRPASKHGTGRANLLCTMTIQCHCHCDH